MISPLRLLTLSLLLAAAALSASCKSSNKPVALPKNLPKVNVSSSAASPRHSMSRGEYPFDERGNYITAWAAEGPRSSGRSTSSSTSYEDWSSSHDSYSAVPPPSSTKTRSRRRSASMPVSASVSPSVSPAPTMILSSTGSQQRLTHSQPPPAISQPPPSRPPVTSSSRPAQTASAPRPSPTTTASSSPKTTTSSPSKAAASSPPKPKPKPSAPASASHTVKSGDTLYGIALRYKSTVAKIKSANGLKSDLIRPGQTLRVPK